MNWLFQEQTNTKINLALSLNPTLRKLIQTTTKISIKIASFIEFRQKYKFSDAEERRRENAKERRVGTEEWQMNQKQKKEKINQK